MNIIVLSDVIQRSTKDYIPVSMNEDKCKMTFISNSEPNEMYVRYSYYKGTLLMFHISKEEVGIHEGVTSNDCNLSDILKKRMNRTFFNTFISNSIIDAPFVVVSSHTFKLNS